MEKEKNDQNPWIRVGKYTFSLAKMISSGATAVVYEGHEVKNSKKKVAVKVLNQDIESMNFSKRRDIINELHIMYNIDPKQDKTVKVLHDGEVFINERLGTRYYIVT